MAKQSKAASTESTESAKQKDVVKALHSMQKERENAGVTLTDKELLFIRKFVKEV